MVSPATTSVPNAAGPTAAATRIAGPYLSIFRIVVGLLFTLHGTASLFGCNKAASEATSTAAGSSSAAPAPKPAEAIELLNVSYDPTRELWREINEKFTASYSKEANVTLTSFVRFEVGTA